ncbi:MAG: glycosyltransferase family 1 protein [Chitinophagaceae bacterium]|jgi:glycosyltransferase involved in cell wall biosynthesis|nr:MAG: glycosyltransferase family 1 protein [Chitinophagaceae bacterium]
MSGKKRVTHLLYSGLGGHGSVFFSLVKADEQKLFHTEAVFCGIEKVRAEYIERCQLYRIPFYSVMKKKGIDIATYRKVYASFRKSAPDIIFLHGPSFILPAIVYKWKKKRVKIVLRDTQAYHLKSRMDWIWLQIAARFVSNIVFLTEEAKTAILQRIKNKAAAGKAVVIANGLDVDLYSPSGRKPVRDRLTIGMQSRLQPIKDHPTLIRAFALLKNRMPHLPLFLRIAGDGETMGSLVALVKELAIGDYVEFCGMLNEEDLLEFMLSLDIYVHATFGETMSNSIIQAMACGLPIVASNVWGVNNMIEDNVNGILYASGNEDMLCDSILQLMTNPAEAERLSKQAREVAIAAYSNKTVFEKYRNLLNV